MITLSFVIIFLLAEEDLEEDDNDDDKEMSLLCIASCVRYVYDLPSFLPFHCLFAVQSNHPLPRRRSDLHNMYPLSSCELMSS